ncbi:MAG: molybdopterin molybdotransferase MoeA [Actinomycetia bacterium]|nr:molybdopterin molybdotransferase MoeA [Actinomycetes bacterium]
MATGSEGMEDVRMRGFRERASVEATLTSALDGVQPLPFEQLSVTECAGRVLATDVQSEVDVPPFRRATMDGFAVRAEDTYGASDYEPVFLDLTTSSMPGRDEGEPISHGAAGPIMTGAPVPRGADAVLRAEDATERGGRLEVTAPVAKAKNIGRIGEDVKTGSKILSSGRLLLPQDAGLLASVGVDPVQVYRRPVVRIIVSGDELLPPGDKPDGFKIVDSNSPMLAALVSRDGGIPQVVRLPDDAHEMRRALALPGADVIVTAGAASVGREDRVPLLVGELGELLVHGVSMRPSSPTGVGRIDGRPVLLLPGNPVSCLVAYDFFAGPVIRVMGGRPSQWPYTSVTLPLRKRLVSQIGRTDYARVLIVDGEVEPVAISGASVLSSVTRASGFVVIPAGLEGYGEGTDVEVHLYEAAGQL